jgi:dTDP-4-dehydrorhamnose 3,5-epimerase-like enzyme
VPDETSPVRPRHRLVDLPQIGDDRGWLLVAEEEAQVPFDIRRLFVLHSLPEGANRGHHAHREQHQFLMFLAGGCEVVVDDGRVQHSVTLESCSKALYAPPMLWLELRNFLPGSICAVLVSGPYDEADYIRDRAEYRRLIGTGA